MVPIKPTEMILELLIEEIKEATWQERRDALKFLLWEVPTGLLVELFYWLQEKAGHKELPEHWLDQQRGITHTPKLNPSDLGNHVPRYH